MEERISGLGRRTPPSVTASRGSGEGKTGRRARGRQGGPARQRARRPRAMGYDPLYFKFAEDRHLLQLAHVEARALLTRDARLARLAGAGGLLVHATEVEPQVAEVIECLALHPSGEDFLSRCLECNTRLVARSKDSATGLVPASIFARHDR